MSEKDHYASLNHLHLNFEQLQKNHAVLTGHPSAIAASYNRRIGTISVKRDFGQLCDISIYKKHMVTVAKSFNLVEASSRGTVQRMINGRKWTLKRGNKQY